MLQRRVRALVLICVCVLHAACDVQPASLLRVGTNIWPGYEPLYLARELNYFSSDEVRLVEFASATQVIRAFRNHAIDAATLTLDETLLLAQDVPDIRVVTVMDVSSGADVILAQRGISTLHDLRGKRVGVEQTALGGYMLHRALRHAQLTSADVQRVYLQVDEHEHTFLQGDIDAVVTFDPVRARLLAAGAGLLFDSSQIAGEIVDVLVVHRAFLAAQPERVSRLVGAWFRAVAYLEAQPKHAATLMAPRLGVDARDLLDSYRLIEIPRYAENLEWLGDNGTTRGLVDSAQQLVTFMQQAGLLRRPVAVEALPDAGPLHAVSELSAAPGSS